MLRAYGAFILYWPAHVTEVRPELQPKKTKVFLAVFAVFAVFVVFLGWVVQPIIKSKTIGSAIAKVFMKTMPLSDSDDKPLIDCYPRLGRDAKCVRHDTSTRDDASTQGMTTSPFHILPSEVLPIITKRMAFYMTCKEFYVFVPAGVEGLRRSSACSWASREGHLEVLKYAHENGCPWNSWTCSSAARRGHLEVLKYAHENGCPWDELTCSRAARGGHLNVLKHLHENGCPWDKHTWSSAHRGGHLDVLAYARGRGCPE